MPVMNRMVSTEALRYVSTLLREVKTMLVKASICAMILNVHYEKQNIMFLSKTMKTKEMLYRIYPVFHEPQYL